MQTANPRLLLLGAASLLLIQSAVAQHRWSWRVPRTDAPAFYAHVIAHDWLTGENIVFISDQSTWSWNGFRAQRGVTLNTGLTAPSGAVDLSVGDLHLIGGPDGALPVSSSHWTFNSVSGIAQQRAAAPFAPRVDHRVTAANGAAGLQHLFLFGGSDGMGGFFGDAWTFDVTTGLWTQQASQPAARSRHAMAFDGTQFVFVFGGLDAAGVLNDFWQFDTVFGTWTQLVGGGPAGRCDAGMAFDATRNVLLLGGGTDLLVAFEDCWEFAVASGTWTQVAKLPFGLPPQQFAPLPSRGTIEALSRPGLVIPFSYEPVPPVTPQAASMAHFRQGCSTGGDPFLVTNTIPVLNATYTIDVLALGATVVVLTLDSRLQPFNPDDCSLHTGTLLTFVVPIVNGVGSFSLTVPNDPNLVSQEVFQQAIGQHPLFPRLAFSNTLRLTVGTF